MTNTAQNNVGFSQGYIDRLVEAQKDAEGKLKEMNAYYSSASAAFNDAKTWEDKIKIYWDNIKNTEDLADTIIADLEKLDIQVECVCSNASGYVEAVKILVCCVKEVGGGLEMLNDDFRDLMTRIDCVKSKEPSLDSSKSILKCLDEYRIKLEAALASALEALKVALELLKCANLILDEKRGLQSFITYLWEVAGLPDRDKLKGGEPPTDCMDSNCYPGPKEDAGCIVIYRSPCELIGDKEVPTLEIECGKYYTDTRLQNEAAKQIRQDMEEKRKKAQMVKDSAQAKYDAASRALADAKAAKECK